MALPDMSLKSELFGLYTNITRMIKENDDRKDDIKRTIGLMKDERLASVYESELSAEVRADIDALEASL